MKKRRMKVVRVTKSEFELEDGRVIPHVVELGSAPTVEKFQEYLDSWYNVMPLGEKDE